MKNELTLKELQHPTAPLAELYSRKLLKRTWAGSLSTTERKYRKWARGLAEMPF